MDKMKKPNSEVKLKINKGIQQDFVRPPFRGEFRIFEEYKDGPKKLIYEHTNVILNLGGEAFAKCFLGLAQVKFMSFGNDLFGGPDADHPFDPSPNESSVGDFSKEIDAYITEYNDRVTFVSILEKDKYNTVAPITCAELLAVGLLSEIASGSGGDVGYRADVLNPNWFQDTDAIVGNQPTIEITSGSYIGWYHVKNYVVAGVGCSYGMDADIFPIGETGQSYKIYSANIDPLAMHSFPQIEKTSARRITFEWTIIFHN